MRDHEPFTLLPRRMPSGLTVWYYQARAEDRRRTTARGTGQTIKSTARARCCKLQKEPVEIRCDKNSLSIVRGRA